VIFAILLLAGIVVGSMLSRLGTIRARDEERSYALYASNQRQVKADYSPDELIISTDDHYLHPDRVESSPQTTEALATRRAA
jgi:hypothetical protein